MQKVEAGMYEASILDYGISLTQAGKPQVVIRFGLTDKNGDLHELNWYGSLNEGKAQEITCKALLACGMKGNDLNILADGIPSGVLDTSTHVKVTVAHEEQEDGTTRARIKWINPLGGLTKKLTKSEASVKLGALNLRGAMMTARTETGILDRPAPKQAVGQSQGPSEDDDFSWGV